MKLPGHLTRAKGFDTFDPVGPCIATDLDPSSLTIRTYLNGELKQEGKISDLIFPIDYLIHYMSQCMTLYPRDIISTGSPPGTGSIKPGDIVEVTVKEIGVLRKIITF
jgi:2-keto-4-pentenoate hydratase/2-oxohepta-3-ene-1,7-dioic acid hydratase in catechol pathway